MTTILPDITAAIGKSRLVELPAMQPPGGARIAAKLEFDNPGASIKDRICLSMLDDAASRGLLEPGSWVVESTSGNTGIGLALICAARGYHCVLTMPETMSTERVRLLQRYGAQVTLTSREGGMAEAILTAEQIAQQKGNLAYMPMQFDNPANPEAHRRTTAPEILAAAQGQKIAAFVAAVGTGGTITGVGEALKEADPGTLVVAVEPTDSPVLSGGKPGAHGIQGIGAGFIPAILNLDIIDEILTVSTDEALGMQRTLASSCGVMAGISSGANVAAARRIAARMAPDGLVITVLCDTGERYLSLQNVQSGVHHDE